MGYSHDTSGNVTAISDAITPAASQSFAYDDLNRLTAANGVYGAYGYAYDLSGNRIASSRPAANEAYTIALGSNRLMQIGGGAARSFTYDAAGNAANDNRGPGADYTYTYDAAGGMAQADRDGLTLARYTTDAAHLRAIRDLPGAAIPKTHFIYDADGNLLSEHDGVSGAVLREVVWLPASDGAVLPIGWVDAAASGAPLYMVHADHLGRPQKLTDAAGAIVWDGVFGPFGEAHAITGSLAQNLRFPGQYADSETALSYNWHRSYDSSLGRYLQSDPIGMTGGINTYAYVNGNPVMWVDPTGECPWCIAAGIGALTGAGLDLGLQLYQNDGNLACVDWKSVSISALLGAAGGGLFSKAGKLIGKSSSVTSKEITLSRSAHGEAAEHAADAIRAGKPSQLTINRSGVPANRAAATRGLDKVPGKHLDEYPPAMFKEGGTGASVRPINPRDNMSAGACIGNACRGLPDGSRIRIRVGD
ncbi:MAG: RHS repeat-associated core domain-containing protein [Alphaproteobacteria bacterium]